MLNQEFLQGDYQTKILPVIQLGNPLLRRMARPLQVSRIKTRAVQEFIADTYRTLTEIAHGVGIAAPQMGKS
jgi:peptide deformylase